MYISDHFLPYAESVNWEEFSLILKPRKINKLNKILKDSLDNGDYSNYKIFKNKTILISLIYTYIK